MVTSNIPQDGQRALPGDTWRWWEGRLPAFSPVMEGGGGTPVTLGIIAGLSLIMAIAGFRLMDSRGIDSFGPALILLAVLVFFTLLTWVLIKEGLRPSAVLFYITPKGVGILPSPAQRRLDARMAWLSRLVFLLTWKGGQWGAFEPYTTWKSVRRVRVDEAAREILITGGPWHVRLPCRESDFAEVRDYVLEATARLAPRARITS